jgi:uncharacterized membrane protein
MNDMTPLYWTLLLLRYLHILSAIALMGGTIFAYFAVAPSLGELSGTDSAKFHAALRTRWSKFVMIATGLLLVTGIANMLIYPMYFDLGDMRGQYSMWTGIKFLLALPIFFFAALLTGRSSLAQKIQANARTYLAINLLLALSMVLIGGALRFVDRHPKEDQLEEPLSRSLLPEGTLSRSLEGASLPVGGTY